MHEAAAVPAWVMLAYLVAGVCFILALRGLSSPETSRTGNRVGMLGMGIAVATTLASHEIASFWEIAAAILVGGAIGFVIARRIAMTAMPQLVAAFHSLVGMAAVLVGAAAFLNPEAFGIATRITVRLIPIPGAVVTLLADFDSVRTAGQAVSAIIASGLEEHGRVEIADL